MSVVLKGVVHKNSLFTVVSSVFDFLSSVEHKLRYFEKSILCVCVNKLSLMLYGQHFSKHILCSATKNKNKFIWIWLNMKVSQSLHNCIVG